MSTSAVIHLIDDDEDVRKALAFLLTTAGYAVRVYESAVAFLAAASTVQPGCIVSDLRMADVDGLELQRRLKGLAVNLPVIIMTAHGDVPLAVEAMKAGAVDFIEKPFDDEMLLKAISTALDYYSAAGQRNSELLQIQEKLLSLSSREMQVLKALLLGHANKTIAYDLNLSPRTVEVHRANVMTKMGAASLPDLIRMAFLANTSEAS
jgi:two-component system response regulator FixJ